MGAPTTIRIGQYEIGTRAQRTSELSIVERGGLQHQLTSVDQPGRGRIDDALAVPRQEYRLLTRRAVDDRHRALNIEGGDGWRVFGAGRYPQLDVVEHRQPFRRPVRNRASEDLGWFQAGRQRLREQRPQQPWARRVEALVFEVGAKHDRSHVRKARIRGERCRFESSFLNAMVERFEEVHRRR